MIDDAITEYKKALDINYASPRVYNNMGLRIARRRSMTKKLLPTKRPLRLTLDT